MEARIATSAAAGALSYGGMSIETRIAFSPAAEALARGDWRIRKDRRISYSRLLDIGAGGARNISVCVVSPYPDLRLCLRQRCMRLVCAAAGEREVYQPFRPPPSVVNVPGGTGASPEEQLEILRERRGFWHEYAVVVPFLTRAGYTPAQIDEATGVTGVEQNMIVVASQVRLSLKTAGVEQELLSFFDVGGAELLYELRILSTDQRRASAEFVVERKMDPKETRELARSVKDYERRKRDEGWRSFSSKPGDCLAFAFYRQSKEAKTEAEKESEVNSGLTYAVTESARAKLRGVLRPEEVAQALEQEVGRAQLQVVRLPSKQDAASSPLPVILPGANDLASVKEAPLVAAVGDGPFNVYSSLPPWKAWLAIPGWPSILAAKAPIALVLPDGSILPPQPKKQSRGEPVLVVVDKGSVNLEEDAHFLVEEDGKLALLAGFRAAAASRQAFGKVLVVLRPPLPETEEMEDWE